MILLDTPPHDATSATLDIARSERRPVAVALNRVPPQGKLTEQVAQALRGKGLTLLDVSLGNRTGFATAFAAGLGVTEAAPRSLAADEVRALASALKGLAPRR